MCYVFDSSLFGAMRYDVKASSHPLSIYDFLTLTGKPKTAKKTLETGVNWNSAHLSFIYFLTLLKIHCIQYNYNTTHFPFFKFAIRRNTILNRRRQQTIRFGVQFSDPLNFDHGHENSSSVTQCIALRLNHIQNNRQNCHKP